MRFTGKSVIVTGASSGIGRSAAMAFVEEGAGVLLVGRNKGALEEVGREMKAPGQVATCGVDVTTDEAPAIIVKAAAGAWGGIDVLVNAAGVIATGTLESTPDAQWDAMMAINLRAPFRLMREAFPHLKARKGTVVNVSSVNGLRSFAGVLS